MGAANLNASASHYIFTNLQDITFIVVIWAHSFSCFWIHLAKISWYKRWVLCTGYL